MHLLDGILTASEVPSSRKLMALLTSSLQSWRATMQSSWFFPVTSMSYEQICSSLGFSEDFNHNFTLMEESFLYLFHFILKICIVLVIDHLSQSDLFGCSLQSEAQVIRMNLFKKINKRELNEQTRTCQVEINMGH